MVFIFISRIFSKSVNFKGCGNELKQDFLQFARKPLVRKHEIGKKYVKVGSFVEIP